MVSNYRELVVWQRAMELVKETYRIVRLLPKEETYALSDQMRRAAISIPSNIAEGQARNSTKEFIQFLSIARGSKAELQTQLLICVQLKYVTEEEIYAAMCMAEEVGKMIGSLISKLITDH